MSRPALRPVPPVEQKEDAPRLYVDQVQPLLDADAAGRLLGGLSASQVDRLREHRGLPTIDLSVGDPRRRPKGCFRYDPIALREWWRARQSSGGAQ